MHRTPGGRRVARLALLAGLSTGLGATMQACGGDQYGAPVRVIIPAGSTFRAATDSLAHAHVISTPGLFRLYAKARRRDRDIKAGTYLLRRGPA